MRFRDVSGLLAAIGLRKQINIRGENQEVQFWFGLSGSCTDRRRRYKVSGSTERAENLTHFNIVVVQ